MRGLENRLKAIATENGAALVGIASRQRLSDAPPSGDPEYLLSTAQSIISFAVPYDAEALESFFSKRDWRSFNVDKKEKTRRLYAIGDRLVNLLKGEGFEAVGVDINNNYRPEKGAKDFSGLVAMIPDFSHRYGAVAAGIGRLGWSGNVITPQYGSAVILATVLTSAELYSDPLLEENPCDGCKMCVASCPVEMIHKKEGVEVQIAGITEEIAKKRTNNCCWIGCDGYHSLSPNRKWSNWSPYRVDTPFPDKDALIDELCTRIRKADPDANRVDLNAYTNFRQCYFDPDFLPLSVCAHCANICLPNREDRIETMRRLTASGIVVLRADGRRSAVAGESDILEFDTPFHVRVSLLREEVEAARRGDIDIRPDSAFTLKDKMVLNRLQQL
jgi:ferredoxin